MQFIFTRVRFNDQKEWENFPSKRWLMFLNSHVNEKLCKFYILCNRKVPKVISRLSDATVVKFAVRFSRDFVADEALRNAENEILINHAKSWAERKEKKNTPANFKVRQKT